MIRRNLRLALEVAEAAVRLARAYAEAPEFEEEEDDEPGDVFGGVFNGLRRRS